MSLSAMFSPLAKMSGSMKFLAIGLSLGPCGFFPWAPGTVGSSAAVLFLALFPKIFGNKLLAFLAVKPLFWISAGLLTLFFFYAGKLAIDRLLATLGPQDFAWIVFDEALGILLTTLLALAIVVGRQGSEVLLNMAWIKFWVLVLVSFRIFDISKIFPVGWIDQHWINGAGIMLDDLLAAIYAGCLSGILYLFWA